MKENFNFSPEAIRQLITTPEGQQLLRLVRQADPAVMRQAAQAMQSGDTATAAALLEPLAKQSDVAALLQKLQGGR